MDNRIAILKEAFATLTDEQLTDLFPPAWRPTALTGDLFRRAFMYGMAIANGEKVYVAGKMTGDPNFKEKFANAEKQLTALGYVVLNPAKNADGMTRAEYMRIDLNLIDMAEAVYFLADWKDSEGAKLERHYCEYIGKTMVEEV